MRIPGQAAITRAQKMLGREFNVINYRFDDSSSPNAYADGEFVETDTSPQTTPATIDFGDATEVESDGEGASVEQDAVIYIQPDSVDITDGTNDESRATEFVDTKHDVRYRTVSLEHQLHLVAVHVKEI